MTTREDREEFENTGVQGLLRQLMATSEEGFVRILPGGWRGQIVAARPTPGSGPYIHYRRGEPAVLHSNSAPDDDRVDEYRVL